MRAHFAVVLILGVFNTFAFASSIAVHGPQRYEASPNRAIYQESFQNTKANADGVLTVLNGNGEDLTPVDCSKKPVGAMIACKAENVRKHLLSVFDRPTQIEISLNGKPLVTNAQLPDLKGKYQTAIKVGLQNSFKVLVKGKWSASVTVEVKADGAVSNTPPTARVSATPDSGIAPALITFSGLLSSDSDPDDLITTYTWDFGDGQFGTGAIVSHNYMLPGTYLTKLTVT